MSDDTETAFKGLEKVKSEDEMRDWMEMLEKRGDIKWQ